MTITRSVVCFVLFPQAAPEAKRVRDRDNELKTNLLDKRHLLAFIETAETDFAMASTTAEQTKSRVLHILSGGSQSSKRPGKSLPLFAAILSDFLSGTVSKLARFLGLDVLQQPKTQEGKSLLTGGDLLRKFYPTLPSFYYSLVSNSFHALHLLLSANEIVTPFGEPEVVTSEGTDAALKILQLLQCISLSFISLSLSPFSFSFPDPIVTVLSIARTGGSIDRNCCPGACRCHSES